jgi:hypothetical protein
MTKNSYSILRGISFEPLSAIVLYQLLKKLTSFKLLCALLTLDKHFLESHSLFIQVIYISSNSAPLELSLVT